MTDGGIVWIRKPQIPFTAPLQGMLRVGPWRLSNESTSRRISDFIDRDRERNHQRSNFLRSFDSGISNSQRGVSRLWHPLVYIWGGFAIALKI
jgi:hypothetical protein